MDLTLGYEVGVPKAGPYPYIDPRDRGSVEGSIEVKALKEGEVYLLSPKGAVLWLSKELGQDAQ